MNPPKLHLSSPTIAVCPIDPGTGKIIRLRVQDPETRTDLAVLDLLPEYARALAENLLSVTRPR